jgi:hypothetical protein
LLLLLLLLLLHRLLHQISLSIISMRTSSWGRRLASRSVTVAGCRADLDVFRIRRLRSVLRFDVRSSEKVQTKGFLFPAAFLFAPLANVRWWLGVTTGWRSVTLLKWNNEFLVIKRKYFFIIITICLANFLFYFCLIIRPFFIVLSIFLYCHHVHVFS